MIDNRSL